MGNSISTDNDKSKLPEESSCFEFWRFFDGEIFFESSTSLPNDCSYLFQLFKAKKMRFKCDTTNVIDMSGMFDHCKNLAELDLNSFNTSNVINMGWMFNRCSSLK